MAVKRIVDEFSNIKNRSIRRQKRLQRDGKCRVCGMPRSEDSKVFCPKHAKINRERAREACGSKPWVPGGMGRVPNSRK